MIPDDPRLDALQRYADGLATREDLALVERAIIEDAEFRALAVEYLHLDSAMEEFAVERVEVPVVKPVRRAYWAFAAAAAIAVIGLSLWHLWPAKSPVAQPSVAKPPVVEPPPVQPNVAPVELAQVEVEVLRLRDATISGPRGGMKVHDRVRLDAFNLVSGEVQLRLPSDVKLLVSGPAELHFVDALQARLLHGKVSVDCGVRGRGFILDTPVARVVDVSTQFGVDARADGTTDVLVIRGKVELYHTNQAEPVAQLEQGEAVRVDAAQAIKPIATITGGREPGDWSTQPPPGECNIVSVSDNLGAAKGYHFHRIVPHGMRPGVLVHANGANVWAATDGKDFPAALLNADIVQTFQGDMSRREYALEIVVARPVELFVLMPGHGNPPGWLTENYTRTGDELSAEEGGAATPVQRPFEVWKRTLSQAGVVRLGAPNRDSKGKSVGMYVIAAKALLSQK